MPGPAPAYQPDFPLEFVDQALAIIHRRTVPRQQWQRAMLVVLFDGDPEIPNPHAAEEVGMHENSVRNWRRRWAGGDFSLEDKPGRGGKPGFSPLGTGLGEGGRLRVGQ